jgi:hypothetical protein
MSWGEKGQQEPKGLIRVRGKLSGIELTVFPAFFHA